VGTSKDLSFWFIWWEYHTNE